MSSCGDNGTRVMVGAAMDIVVRAGICNERPREKSGLLGVCGDSDNDAEGTWWSSFDSRKLGEGASVDGAASEMDLLFDGVVWLFINLSISLFLYSDSRLWIIDDGCVGVLEAVEMYPSFHPLDIVVM